MMDTYSYTNTHTHTIYSTHCYSTATMVTRARLIVTSYYIACLNHHCGGMPVDMTDSLNTAFMHIVYRCEESARA